MVRTRSLSRSATRLVAIVPFAVMLAAGCGGSDTIPFDDGGPGGTVPDGAVPDTSTGVDGTVEDAPVADGPVPDSTVADGGEGGVADAADGSHDGAADTSTLVDGSDAEATEDAKEDLDARDASDGGLIGLDAGLDASKDASLPDASLPDASLDAGLDATLDAGLDAGLDASLDAGLDGSSAPGFLASAAQFAVFSGASVANNGTADTITGDLGVYPSPTPVGPTAPVVIGAQHLGDTVAKNAALDIRNAYLALEPGNLPCGTDLSATPELGGTTKVPGVYCFSSTAAVTGTLTLDAKNNPNAVWVFQVGSALTTSAISKVVIINGAAGQVCNAYWQITSSATIGTDSIFGGNILALAAVTLNARTVYNGRIFGRTAAVTTDSNVISIAGCGPSVPVPGAAIPDGGFPDDGGLDASLPDAEGTDADLDDAGDAD